MKYTKNRYRSNITNESLHDVLRITSTERAPCMDTLLHDTKQFHTSH